MQGIKFYVTFVWRLFHFQEIGIGIGIQTKNKTMKRIFRSATIVPGLLLASIFVFSSCRHKEPAIQLSGLTVSKTYPFRDFQQLKISGLFEINLIPYHKDSLVVTTDSSLFQYLFLEQRGNKVSISFDLGDAHITAADKAKNDSTEKVQAIATLRNLDLDEMKPVVDIYYLKLENIDAKGAALLRAEKPLKTDIFKMELAGASKFTGNLIINHSLDIQAVGASRFEGSCMAPGKASVEVTGASQMDWSGFIGKAYLEATGASNIQSFEMVIDNLDAKATGASEIDATVNKHLNGTASGASHIRYKGTPEVKASVSGASAVKPA